MGICLSIIAALLSLTMHVHAAGPAEMKEVKKMDTALLIFDAQVNMWESEYPLHNGAELLRKLETLVADARKAGILVVYIQNNGVQGIRTSRERRDGKFTQGSLRQAEISSFRRTSQVRLKTPTCFRSCKGKVSRVSSLRVYRQKCV